MQKKIIRVIKSIKYYGIRVFFVVAALDALAWASYGGYQYAKGSILPVTVYAEKNVPVATMPDVPILDKIVQCESGGHQYGENGQVLMHANTNNTVDIGWGQVNVTVWGKKAKEMGYDLTNENDNKAFTTWLFLNYGDTPWLASKACWNK